MSQDAIGHPKANGYSVAHRRLQQDELCAWWYPGIDTKCSEDAVGFAVDSRGDLIPFCEQHLEEGTE